MTKNPTKGNVVKFPGKGKPPPGKAPDKPWPTAIECLQEAIDDIKKSGQSPDWLFVGTGYGFGKALDDPNSMKPGAYPDVSFMCMGMNTMELVGFLTLYINALLRGAAE